MRGPVYKMPPPKPLLKVEDLDKKVEDIIDSKLKDIFSRLEKIEKTIDIHDHLWDITADAFTKVPIPKQQQQQDKEN